MSAELGSFEIELRLRVCRPHDLAALEWLGLFGSQREVIRTTFEQQTRGEGMMLLAVANEFPLGQLWLDFRERGTPRCPRIWALRVFPPLQGAGIGTWLLRAAERIAKAQGARRIELGVEKANRRGRRLYERLGYGITGSERTSGPDTAEVIDQHLLSKQL